MSSGSVSSYTKQKTYVLEKMSEERFAKKVATDTKYRIKLNDSYWENKRLKDIHHDLDNRRISRGLRAIAVRFL
jgi:hypothetical protein